MNIQTAPITLHPSARRLAESRVADAQDAMVDACYSVGLALDALMDGRDMRAEQHVDDAVADLRRALALLTGEA